MTWIRSFGVSGARHAETVTELDVETELDRLLSEAHADAATQVKVTAVDYDSGSHTSAANWKWAGWLFEANAAVLLAYGVTADTHDERVVLCSAGGIVAGIGILTYLVSFLQDDPTTWQFRVEGSSSSSGRAPRSRRLPRRRASRRSTRAASPRSAR